LLLLALPATQDAPSHHHRTPTKTLPQLRHLRLVMLRQVLLSMLLRLRLASFRHFQCCYSRLLPQNSLLLPKIRQRCLAGKLLWCRAAQKARSMTRLITQVSASLTGRNASSHMSYIDLSNRNCAARNYFTKGKKHDPVNHLGLRRSDLTKRLKSDELYEGEARARASASTETCIQ